MIRFRSKRAGKLLALSTLALAIGGVIAGEKGEHPGTTEGEMATRAPPAPSILPRPRT